jgi:hypothetical protein
VLSIVDSAALANSVASAVTTPFVAAVIVLVYFDLRVRNEGLDLDELGRALAAGGGFGSGPSDPGPLPRPPSI